MKRLILTTLVALLVSLCVYGQGRDPSAPPPPFSIQLDATVNYYTYHHGRVHILFPPARLTRTTKVYIFKNRGSEMLTFNIYWDPMKATMVNKIVIANRIYMNMTIYSKIGVFNMLDHNED